MGVVGIVAKTNQRAEFIRRKLGVDPRDVVAITHSNAARGCLFDVVIWADDDIDPAVRDSVLPAAFYATTLEVTSG